jgi:5'-phosphate synthase pdxT subunit
LKIGVLSLQGDFKNHIDILKELNINVKEVKYSNDFDSLDGLIIPGGESTAISNLIVQQGLYEVIEKFVNTKPVYGTCAGLILLSSRIMDSNNFKKNINLFKVLDIEIERNGWGRQIDSFVQEIKIKPFKKDYKAIFIRAPKIKSLHKSIEILSEFSDTPVMIKKGYILGTTFHPELTKDIRVHEYFINMVKEYKIEC